MEAVGGLHQVADLARALGKSSLFEFRNCPAPYDPAQLAAVGGTARILRVFLGQFGKVSPGFDLLEDVGGLGPRLIHRLLVYLPIRSGLRSRNEDVAYLYPLGHAIVILMRSIVSLQVAAIHGNFALYFLVAEHKVAELALFRNRVH